MNSASRSTKPDPNRDPDEDRDIDSLIAEGVPAPDHWKKSPNDQLGGNTPGELLLTEGGSQRVRELVRAIKHGYFT